MLNLRCFLTCLKLNLRGITYSKGKKDEKDRINGFLSGSSINGLYSLGYPSALFLFDTVDYIACSFREISDFTFKFAVVFSSVFKSK